MHSAAQDKEQWVKDHTNPATQPGPDIQDKPMGIDATLDERGKRYGSFVGHARITQDMKNTMKRTAGWQRLSATQVEALEMIAHKIGRILNGDPNYDDSWRDIGGYSELIVKELNGQIK
jgi:hypothetical protein